MKRLPPGDDLPRLDQRAHDRCIQSARVQLAKAKLAYHQGTASEAVAERVNEAAARLREAPEEAAS